MSEPAAAPVVNLPPAPAHLAQQRVRERADGLPAGAGWAERAPRRLRRHRGVRDLGPAARQAVGLSDHDPRQVGAVLYVGDDHKRAHGWDKRAMSVVALALIFGEVARFEHFADIVEKAAEQHEIPAHRFSVVIAIMLGQLVQDPANA